MEHIQIKKFETTYLGSRALSDVWRRGILGSDSPLSGFPWFCYLNTIFFLVNKLKGYYI